MSKNGPVTRAQASALLAQTDSDNPDHPKSVSEVPPVDNALPTSGGTGKLGEGGVRIHIEPGFNVPTDDVKIDSDCPLSGILATERSVPSTVEDEITHLRGLVTGLMNDVTTGCPAVAQQGSRVASNDPRVDEADRRSASGPPTAGVTISRKHTFDGSVSWSAYHAQFEIIALHNRWSELRSRKSGKSGSQSLRACPGAIGSHGSGASLSLRFTCGHAQTPVWLLPS